MTRASFQIATYQYYDWSSRNSSRSNLVLTGTGGESCGVFFEVNESATLNPATAYGDSYTLYYYQSSFQHLIDMLRYEKPIYVHFDNENGYNNSRISTTDEPVGEGMES